MNISISAKCCPERPRSLLDSSKSAHDAAQTTPRAPKTPPRRLQERPRRFPNGSKSAQDASWVAPGAPKTPPRRPQERLRCHRSGSKSPRTRSGRLQDARESAQEPPRHLDRPPKRLQNAATEVTKCLAGGSLQHKFRQAACSQDRPVTKTCPSLRPAPLDVPVTLLLGGLVRRRTTSQ